MKVINRTEEKLIAFGWHQKYGAGKDVEINPGETGIVHGPYVGGMDGGDCLIALEGEVYCQATPDDDCGFFVAKGAPLYLNAGKKGAMIRHGSEERPIIA